VIPLKAFDLYVKGANDMDQLVQNSSELHTGPDHAIEVGEAPAANTHPASAAPAANPAWSPATATQRHGIPPPAAWDMPPPGPAHGVPAARRNRPLAPSECNSCQQGGGLVYALGELGFDFGTQARMDAIAAQLDEGRSPNHPRDLLDFLTNERASNLHVAAAVMWTLNHDAMPFYAVRPEGAFARETYSRLLEFFADQIDARAERVSIPGVLDGTVTLMSGQQVPVLIPDLRGMYNWRTSDLIASVMGAPPEGGEERRQFDSKMEGMQNFLERIYFEVRNLGQTPQERALNFAATNAFNLERVFESAASRRLQLDEIGIDRSPICRPDSECWDVRLIFFDPNNALGAARTAYRFTVDVSDVVPVLVGRVRSWAVR
jgi:cyanobactin maturation PatA/PatG family protease